LFFGIVAVSESVPPEVEILLILSNNTLSLRFLPIAPSGSTNCLNFIKGWAAWRIFFENWSEPR
jgi:hypothetical protein